MGLPNPKILLALGLWTFALLEGAEVRAERVDPAFEEPSTAYHPQGAMTVHGHLGGSFRDSGSAVVVGVGVGYAVWTGVLPGVRGLLLVGDHLGGEVAGTLTLTPPLDLVVTPFVVGEGGRRFEHFFSGWLLGVGGGVFLGHPESDFSLQLGWIYRRFLAEGLSFDVSGPLVSLGLRF